MLDRKKARFDLHPERLIADTAYGTGPMLGWLVERKIAPHIPVFDKSGRSDGTWSRADFEWDADNDQYVCPEGQTLKQFRRNYSDPNRGPTSEGRAKYRALKLTCQACPSTGGRVADLARREETVPDGAEFAERGRLLPFAAHNRLRHNLPRNHLMAAASRAA